MRRFFQQKTGFFKAFKASGLVLLSFTLFATGLANRKLVKANHAQYEFLMGSYFSESSEEFHQRMSWFDEASRGMVIHLGLYSHLQGSWHGQEISGNNAEWIWARLHSEPGVEFTNQEYLDLVKDWNPKQFDAQEIVALAQELGMDYITITAKHHEGFCLWPSEYTEFDIDSTPLKGRDLLQELAQACREAGLRLGIYYSILDWHYALEEARKAGKDWQQMPLGHGREPQDGDAYSAYMRNQLAELITRYDVDFVRFDGDWLDGFLTPERSYSLYEYLRELKPSLLIHERCFSRDFADTPKKDFGTLPNLNPSKELLASQQDPETRQYFEFMLGTQVSWGYDGRRAHTANSQFTSVHRMLECYAILRQVKGNFLLNFGPRMDGSFDPQSVRIAQRFAQLANELDGTGYQKQDLKKITKAVGLDSSLSINQDHFKHAYPEAFQRLDQVRSHQRKINQWERWAQQGKKLDTAKIKPLFQDIKAISRQSSASKDPKVISAQISHYQERVAQLLKQ